MNNEKNALNEKLIKNLEKLNGDLADNPSLELTEQLNKLSVLLAKISEIPEELKQKSALVVTDEKELSSKYLTEKSKNVLKKIHKVVTNEYNEMISSDDKTIDGRIVENESTYVRKVASSVYLSVQVRKDQVEEGVKAICQEVNKLSDNGHIYSCLAPVSSIALVDMPFKTSTCVVFCFPHVKSDFLEEARKSVYSTLEGGIGPSLGSLDIDLKPGEFLAAIYITHSMYSIPGKSREAMIHENINEYLKYLPEGTKFVGYRECGVQDLCSPIELKFFNPLLERITKVDMDYVREVVVLNENGKETLKQFNLFVGMRYWGYDPITKQRNIELFPRKI